MKSNTPLIFVLFLFMSIGLWAQQRPGSLRGLVTEAATGETIPLVNVSIKDSLGSYVIGGATDFDGIYNINPIPPGTYTVEVSFLGFTTITLKGLQILPNSPTIQNFKLQASSELLEEVELVYSAPLVDKVKSAKVTSVAGQAAGVSQNSNSVVRGTRGEGTVYFIDGVKVRGNVNLPQAAIAQTEVITGGTPAQFESPEEARMAKQDQTEAKEISFQLGTSAEPQKQFEGEYYKQIPENKFLSALSTPLSTFGADVDVASYANVRRMLKSGSWPHPDAVRLEEFINYFKYDYPEPKEDEVFSVSLDQGPCTWNEEHRLLRIGLKTASLSAEEMPPSNLVFLIDVSGSMSSPDKLPLLQNAMKIMVKNLNPEDRVAIVVYASSSGLVLESTPASEADKIVDAIDGLYAGGSTAGGAGIQLAYKVAQENFMKEGNNRVILATDGDFNVGLSSDHELKNLIKKERESGVFLSVLGFGTGNYQDAKMESLADHGNGNYAYIDGLLEARKVLATELGANLHVVAKDTKFQIEFNPQKVAAYRLIGYENRLLADEDFDDDKKDAGDIGMGHTVTAVYELILKNTARDSVWDKESELRYQKESLKDEAFGEELAFLKIRYKDPDASKSQLRVYPVLLSESTNPDFAFLSAVLQYGLLLRRSSYAGTSSLESAIVLAEQNLGPDPHGSRREFVQLCKLAQDLQ
ncbi:YfbK domain-containing protein [Croceimicrobium sp.]|uniref:YfbK domain-containing protein n=1 Tax=Croceimicrobium sp. TaxID=2828340 RepID=UPI003BA9E001